MNEELMKSLASLIDETLAEVEALKKSDRFSASEIKLGGPGSGIGGKDPQGSLGKEEDDKKKDKEEDEEEDEDEMDKADGKNSEADPNAGHHQAAKSDTGMPKGTAEKSEGSAEKAEGQNRQADPNGGHHQVAKAEDKEDDKKKDKKDEDKDEDKEEKMKSMMKKSADEANSLLKSYVDQRLSPIEGKLEAIMTLVKELADSPVPSKSASYKTITPLKKSSDEGEGSSLTKSQLVDKLFELKKSGSPVETTDIASAELGSSSDLVKIAEKYNIK